MNARPNITSLQSHILQEEARHPGSTGDFTWILSALSLSAKAIAAKVRRRPEARRTVNTRVPRA